jgi:hypothetical protein
LHGVQLAQIRNFSDIAHVFVLDNGRVTHSLLRLLLKTLLLVGRFIHFFVIATRDLGIEDSLAP